MGFWDVVTGIIPGTLDDKIYAAIKGGNDNPVPPRSDRNVGIPTPTRGGIMNVGYDTDGTYDWNPFPDADDMVDGGFPMPQSTMDVNSGAMNVIVAPSVTQRLKAPRGYVIVEYRGNEVAMLKEIARKCGYWKPQPKPIMTASEGKCLRRAARLTKKIDRIAKMSNTVVGQAPLRRVRGKR